MSKFSNILVHVDSRADTHPALDCAADLAEAGHGKLTIIDMIPEFPWPARLLVGGWERVIESVTLEKKHSLEALLAPLRDRGIDVASKTLDGRTSVAIIREVLRDKHDLVVKSAKGSQSQSSGFFGTTATRLLRKCPCPVLVVKPDHRGRWERVVAAVSAIPEDELHKKLNAQLIELAGEVSAPGRPEVVSAWSVYGESMLKERMRPEEFAELQDRTESHCVRNLDALLQPFGMSTKDEHVHLLHGDAGAQIPEFVRDHDADLLVMGTVGRSGVAGLLMGNTAEHVLRRVECSVLAIKPEGFASPIHF
jgi:nucleotide-binding universal stress UspA family protein